LILGKKRRLGKKIDEVFLGEKLKLTEKIADKDLLLYLGLTNDGNPLYIQHDFASKTIYKHPIVPTILLTGIISSAVSKHLPGPGSHIVEQKLTFPNVVYHNTTLEFVMEVIEINIKEKTIIIQVVAFDGNEDTVVDGTITVIPHLTKD